MIAVFSADIYTDPGTGSAYVVISVLSLDQLSDPQAPREPIDFAGPLAPRELERIRASKETDGVYWCGDLPRSWPTWQRCDHLWTDIIGGEQ